MTQLSCFDKQTVVNNWIPKESCKSIHPFKSYTKKGTQKEMEMSVKYQVISEKTAMIGVIKSKDKASGELKTFE